MGEEIANWNVSVPEEVEDEKKIDLHNGLGSILQTISCKILACLLSQLAPSSCSLCLVGILSEVTNLFNVERL